MKTRKTLICILTGIAVALWGCGREKNELAHDHSHGHEHARHHDNADDHEGDDHEHEDGDEIILSPRLAERMGVETCVVELSDFTPAVKVSGRIEGSSGSKGIASAATSGTLSFASGISVGQTVRKGQTIAYIDTKSANGGDVNAIAKANLQAAKAELDRLTPLYEKKLITAEKYNAAKSAYEVAKSAYSPAAASGAVTAPISGTITELNVAQGEYVEPGTAVATVSDGAFLTLVADLPARLARSVTDFTGARVTSPLSGKTYDLSDLSGRRVSNSAVTAAAGYIPVIFSFNNNGELVPGEIVEAYLLGKNERDALSIPLTAITEQQGSYFVFVKVDEEGYVKTPVSLGESNGKDVEILSGLKPGMEIVSKGVTAIRLAETSGAVPEGHSHSH